MCYGLNPKGQEPSNTPANPAENERIQALLREFARLMLDYLDQCEGEEKEENRPQQQ